MWLLIVVSVLWDHGNYTPVYAFRDFATHAQCAQVEEWINHDRQRYGSDYQSVRTECIEIRKDKS